MCFLGPLPPLYLSLMPVSPVMPGGTASPQSIPGGGAPVVGSFSGVLEV